jgi:hypothetical protein
MSGKAGTRVIRLFAYSRRFLCIAALLAAAQLVRGQSMLIDHGTNLIVNGNADLGSAGTPATVVASIPNWTRSTGSANVLAYGLAGHILLTDPAPLDHGPNYFVGDPGGLASTLTQTIDLSSVASAIGGGNVKFTASAYLGTFAGGGGLPALPQMTVAFQNAGGQPLGPAAAPVGPGGINDVGMSLQQQIGLVPAGTVNVAVTLTLPNAFASADSLSLVLSTLGTSPSSVLGTNLLVNGNAETGPSAPHTSTTLYVPGWSTTFGTSVAPYGGTGWVQTTDPGPADRGVSLFCGGITPGSTMYQDVDVSAATSLIDSGQITYAVSAWLGGTEPNTPTLTYEFFDWSSMQLAPTAQLGPISHGNSALIEASHLGDSRRHRQRQRLWGLHSHRARLLDRNLRRRSHRCRGDAVVRFPIHEWRGAHTGRRRYRVGRWHRRFYRLHQSQPGERAGAIECACRPG